MLPLSKSPVYQLNEVLIQTHGISLEQLKNFLKLTGSCIVGDYLYYATNNTDVPANIDLDILVTTANQKLAKSIAHAFFRNLAKQPSEDELLSSSLDNITKDYRNFYRLHKTFMKHLPTPAHIRTYFPHGHIRRTVTYINPFTLRKINVIFPYYDYVFSPVLSVSEMMYHPVGNILTSNSDTKNPYYPVGTINNQNSRSFYTLPIRHQEKILTQMSRFPQVAFYDSTNVRVPQRFEPDPKEPAPDTSFWQDFIMTSKDLRDPDAYDKLFALFEELGCNFQGAETDINVKHIIDYSKKFDDDLQNIWEFTWRFLWYAETEKDNIVLVHAKFLNPDEV